MNQVEKIVKFLLEEGYKPEEYQQDRIEIVSKLTQIGYNTSIISEAVLDFQWVGATEEDYKMTRLENECREEF